MVSCLLCLTGQKWDEDNRRTVLGFLATYDAGIGFSLKLNGVLKTSLLSDLEIRYLFHFCLHAEFLKVLDDFEVAFGPEKLRRSSCLW